MTSIKRINIPLVVAACFGFGLLAGEAKAQTLESINFTPLAGTAWGDPSVRLDFGDGIGLGTVTFTSVNGGAFHTYLTPGDYNIAPYSAYDGPTTLSDGSIFNPSQESFFTTTETSNLEHFK